MTERALHVRLGVFVGGTLAVLGGLILFFGHTPDFFSQKAAYTIVYPEAPDIIPGTPIRRSGVRIGETRSVDLDPDSGMVRVHIRVDRRYLPRRSDEAVITRGILSGDTSIEFVPRLDENGRPVPRGEVWPPGSTIAGTPPITARSLLTPASGVLANAQQSLDRIVAAFEKLEKLERLGPKVETALDEFTQLAREGRTLIPELRQTARRIQNLIGAEPAEPADGPLRGEAGPPGLFAAAQQQPEEATLKALVKEVQEFVRVLRPAVEDLRGLIRKLEPDLLETVKSARQTFTEIQDVLNPENRKQLAEVLRNINTVSNYIVKISGSLSSLLETAEKTLRTIDQQITAASTVVGDIRAVTRPLAARAEAIVASVSESADQLSKTLAEVRGLLRLLGQDNGTLQKLAVDPSIYQNLDAAAASLARVMMRAEKITRDLEVFADKVARRPELIGLGGVVRPSSGLKEWPPGMGTPPAGLPTYRPDWPPAQSARPSPWPEPLLQPPAPPPIQGRPPR